MGPRDCSLYAIAIGAGLDDAAFTTEGNAGATQLVYPSFLFAASAPLADSWPDPCFGTGDFPPDELVLGEQALELHRAGRHQRATSTRSRASPGSTTRARARWS